MTEDELLKSIERALELRRLSWNALVNRMKERHPDVAFSNTQVTNWKQRPGSKIPFVTMVAVAEVLDLPIDWFVSEFEVPPERTPEERLLVRFARAIGLQLAADVLGKLAGGRGDAAPGSPAKAVFAVEETVPLPKGPKGRTTSGGPGRRGRKPKPKPGEEGSGPVSP